MSPTMILVLQSLLIFLQMGNAAFDSLPQPWPILVAAFIGAFQFFVNHLGNQTIPTQKDGNIKLPGIFPFLLVGLLLCAAPAAQAQESNALFAGPYIVTDSAMTQQVNVSVSARKHLFGAVGEVGDVALETFWDVSGIKFYPLNITHAQYAGSTAASVIVMKPRPWLAIRGMFSPGLLGTDGIATTFKFDTGVYPEFSYKNKVLFDIMPLFTRNTLTGNGFNLRLRLGVPF